MKVYISGQITGLSQDEYHHAFGYAEALLLEEGHEPVNPLKVMACADETCAEPDSKKDDGTFLHSWKCYLKFDINALFECDAIAMLPNWKNSRGAKLELTVANMLHLPTWYFNDDMRLVQ